MCWAGESKTFQGEEKTKGRAEYDEDDEAQEEEEEEGTGRRKKKKETVEGKWNCLWVVIFQPISYLSILSLKRLEEK